MSENQDQRLERMLRARRLEKPGPDLAERIILAAQNTPQLETLTLGQWIRRAFADLHLPRPAFALAATLIAGVILGFNLPPETASPPAEAVHVSSLLYVDEDLL